MVEEEEKEKEMEKRVSQKKKVQGPNCG